MGQLLGFLLSILEQTVATYRFYNGGIQHTKVKYNPAHETQIQI